MLILFQVNPLKPNKIYVGFLFLYTLHFFDKARVNHMSELMKKAKIPAREKVRHSARNCRAIKKRTALFCHPLFDVMKQALLRSRVKTKNPAIGIYYALNHITIGQLVSNCILKTESLLAFGVWFVTGTLVMIFIHVFVHKVLLPGSNLEQEIKLDRNWGAAIVYGIIPLGATVYINTFLPYTCENLT